MSTNQRKLVLDTIGVAWVSAPFMSTVRLRNTPSKSRVLEGIKMGQHFGFTQNYSL